MSATSYLLTHILSKPLVGVFEGERGKERKKKGGEEGQEAGTGVRGERSKEKTRQGNTLFSILLLKQKIASFPDSQNNC